VPAIDDQGGRSWAEVVNVPMKQIELVDKRVPRKLQEPFAEPVFGTV
jgi:hypothetical protein